MRGFYRKTHHEIFAGAGADFVDSLNKESKISGQFARFIFL